MNLYRDLFPAIGIMIKNKQVSIYDSGRKGTSELDELREIFRYRDLVVQFVRRDILTRYKRSVLGVAWTMLNPLGTMLVLSVAFSQVFGREVEGYAAYVLSGLIAWTFFAQTTNAAISHLVWGGGMLKRIYIPRTVFALSALGTGLINLVLSIIPLIIVMLATGVPIKSTILFLPVPILFLMMFALGVGLLISTIAVYFADVAEMYQIVLTAWMYLTPVIYPESILPPEYRIWIVRFNPMYHLLSLFRDPVYHGVIPEISSILLVGAIAFVLLVTSWIIFTRKADEFAYRL
jgi:ABC-2 type transport system permease protein